MTYRNSFFKLAASLCLMALALQAIPQAQAQETGAQETGALAQVQTQAQVQAMTQAMAAQEAQAAALMQRDDVVGTGVGMDENGDPVIKVFARHRWFGAMPQQMDGFPVEVEVTGTVYALDQLAEPAAPEVEDFGDGSVEDEGAGSAEALMANPRGRFDRPVPIGISISNTGACGAGTLGARVSDGRDVFILSNNHVIALSNAAGLNSRIVQPGRLEVNCRTINRDTVARLTSFVRIDFSGRSNLIDAAIARTNTSLVGTATPPDGYGRPQSRTLAARLGQRVQKYGRTTGFTRGRVTALNVTINVDYGGGRVARFVRQIAIEGDRVNFSDRGDSGSLIVEQGSNRPVGLLFAGGGVSTFANRIDDVLDRFGVSIDE